jgi:hypothetical protein
MPIWKLMAQKAAGYVSKYGWNKRQVADKLVTLKQFSDRPESIFKFNKKTNQYQFSTSFDRAWNSDIVKGKKLTGPEAIAQAKKGRWEKKTPAELRAIDAKISKKYIDDIESGKRTTPWMEQTKTTPASRNKMDTAMDLYIKNTLDAPEYQQKGVLSVLRNILQRRMWENKIKNAKRDEIAKLTRLPTMQRYLGQIEEGGYFPQLKKTGDVIEDMRLQTSPEHEILDRIAAKTGRKPDYKKKGTFSHEAALRANLENLKLKNKFTDEIAEDFKRTSMEMLGLPQLMKLRPMQGLINMGEDALDNMSAAMIRSGEATPKGLDEFSKLYDMAGITSLMPGLKGKAIRLGKELPFEQSRSKQIDFMNKAVDYDLKPFWLDLTDHMRSYSGANRMPSFTQGVTPKMTTKRKKLLEEVLRGNLTLDDLGFPKFKKGGVVNGYAAGGLVSIGSKILAKLAKKLSEKELKMLMGSLWKGVDPKQSPAYRRQMNLLKKLGGDRYRWRNVKSEIEGPEIKKSHMADLTPGERVELQTKHADKLWEYQMKKKLGRAMDEDLEYPFLNPENEAFIVTEPRTGLGRYQIRRHLSDAEKEMMETAKQDYPQVLEPRHFKDFRKKMKEKRQDVGPVDKYAVYDWWDEIMNRMRKKPKFKYVKDAKGNIILKEVK